MQPDRILVVDDSVENLSLIEAILQGQGFELILAQNGVNALEQVKAFPPHLILLDVMMPWLDGFEVTRQIRQDASLPFIPILLITAFDHPSAVQGLDLGADDFIRKPVDIDELMARVRSLLRLKHSVDEREQMARMREDFVSRLTHDLRTPLVAAQRMLTLLQQGTLGQLSPNMAQVIQTMSHSNHNLLQMVNTLLEVYRYEADRKRLSFSPVNLPKIILEVIQALKPLADEKWLILTFEDYTEQNYFTLGDSLELHRLFTNLIDNAIKFTERGFVKVRLEVVETKWLVFSVQDTGIGISQEEQKWLFDRFRSGNHRRSGSGLGLHLSRQIAEKHQGMIKVQSQVHQGSIFTVYLKLYENQ